MGSTGIKEILLLKQNFLFISTNFQENFQARARDFRYDFLEEVMKETGATALVTAHHADDQVETILMRLIRGTRLLHLSGIKGEASSRR